MSKWPKISLAELTAKRPICYGVLKPGEHHPSGVPLIRVTDIRNNYLETKKVYRISNELSESFKRSILKGGEVLLSIQGTVGRVALCPKEMAGANVSRTIAVIEPDERINRCYLRYWLLSEASNFKVGGSTRASFNIGDIRKLEVSAPPLPEQKGIVAILDEAFAGIDTAIANTEKNLANARELFESYLNSVFSDAVMQWEEFPIEKHIKFIDYRGKTPKKTSSGLRLITAKNVRMGYLQREPEEFVDPETYDTWMTRGIPKKWDVLFTTEAPLGFACQLDTDEKVVFAQRIITMQPDRDIIHPDYLMFALRSSPIQSRIHEKATGATATGIKASLLKKIAIPVPEIIQQKVIAENAGSLEQESKRLEGIYEEKLTALAELKQSLLQKAFSGELTADAVEEVDTIEAALA
jgi:type I restriction enzyme S subunit